jgi:rubrerythrin
MTECACKETCKLREDPMALDLVRERGVPLEQQTFDWRDVARLPTSKLNDDAFTRVRIILMNGIEAEAVAFLHSMARHNLSYQRELAVVRRAEHHQQTMVNWLLPVDLSPLETTLGFEQTAIEVTAHVAMNEPDPYLAQVHRFGLLEDFDHLYRFSALGDRLYGIDSNNLLNNYTDITPGRPTFFQHRHPHDDLRTCYDRKTASPLTKIHALTILAGEQQTRNYYMNIGPMFADPLARQLYAEIASIEEQHVTQYESIIDPGETWLEKWLLHEVVEVYNYMSCAAWESNPRIKQIWERFVDYELGHLERVKRLFQQIEGRDPFEVLPQELPEPISYQNHRTYVRQVLADEVDLRAVGTTFVDGKTVAESQSTLQYRETVNRNGSPSNTVAIGYQWQPGTELAQHKEGRAK